MLIREDSILILEPIEKMIGDINGNTEPPKEIMKGIYEIPHFGGYPFRNGIDTAENLSISAMGICDDKEQIINQCPELIDSVDRFVVTVTPVLKKNQSSEGGWRWHKWGPYIGELDPQCEYLFDEPLIDGVLIYHIYKKID